MEGERIVDRLDQFMKEKGLKDAQFQRECGISASTLYQIRQGKFAMSQKVIDKVCARYPEINRVWLLTGEGEMLNGVKPTVADGTIMIPVVNLDGRGGYSFNEEVSVSEYRMGEFPFPRDVAHEGDVVIPIYGDSMAPTYVSGSMVLIRPVPLWREYLEFGATYVLALEDDRRIIKEIRKGADDDHYLLASINPQFEDSEISKNIIRSVWRVIMSVRRESL